MQYLAFCGVVASHMAHVFVYYRLLVVIIICIMFVKLRKCWRMLSSAVSLGTPENSAIQKLSIIIVVVAKSVYSLCPYFVLNRFLFKPKSVSHVASDERCMTCMVIKQNGKQNTELQNRTAEAKQNAFMDLANGHNHHASRTTC